MHSATAAEHWGYPRPRGDDESRNASQPEHLVRKEIAALYARWRRRWNHSLVRVVHIGVDHADAFEIGLELDVRFDAPTGILENMLRDVVNVLDKRAVRSYVLLYDRSGAYIGACIAQAGVSNKETVSWSNEPFRFAERLTFGRSAPKVPLRSIAEEVVAVMGRKHLDCSDAPETPHTYPDSIRRMARIGFGLITVSALLAVGLFFIDSAPGALMAIPAAAMSIGFFTLQSVLNKTRRIHNKHARA